MHPLLLKGHERTITHVQFGADGDLLFTCSKFSEASVCVWFTNTGELAGTYQGHTGTVWNCDVTYDTKYLVTASGDNTARVWLVNTGQCVAVIKETAPVRAVNWTLDGKRFLIATDSFINYEPYISIYDWSTPCENPPLLFKNCMQKKLKITCVRWGRMDKSIYISDENGGMAILNPETGKIEKEVPSIHRHIINRFYFDKEKGTLITASKDGTAKLLDAKTLQVMKVYDTGRPVASAVISPLTDHIILGGGEMAETVTTSKLDTRQFRTRFFYKIHEQEVGSIMGHFGTLTAIDVSPDGKMYECHQYDPS